MDTTVLPDRFWSKVVAGPGGCWIWTGSVDRAGYGRHRVDGTYRKAHRVAFEALVGPIPDGLQAGHDCHDRAALAGLCAGGVGCLHRRCCNPSHLVLQTARENLLATPNTFPARNAAKKHCPRGHELAGANLRSFELGRGWRKCRECKNAQQRAAYRARRREQIGEAA
jgi:hypothetical protein